MKKNFSNQLRTYQSLISMLEEHKVQWQDFQPMVEVIDEMNALFQQSETFREIAGASTESVTLIKNKIKKELILSVKLLRDAIIAYAAKNEKHDLIVEMRNKSNFLKISTRETSLCDVCKYIHSKAVMLQNDLLEYKINQVLLDSTNKQIDKFKSKIATPISIIREKKLTNELLKKTHKKISYLFINRLDKLVSVIEMDKPDLAAKYFALRPYHKTRKKKLINNNAKVI